MLTDTVSVLLLLLCSPIVFTVHCAATVCSSFIASVSAAHEIYYYS